ncbi:hypothetical protein B0I37DRAFT_33318 [Chaetomium sp. MPI-CAGE-AT-0009]|nr:hypothetical protein B0I37DRAFT_33318 [Chaetomium sp. MPI-CAGE-AT-0009]
MPNTEPSYGKTPSCPLEALNMDCVVTVLSASDSLADLGAFIRASPAVLNYFLSAKVSIPCDLITKELGLTITDLFIISLTDGIDMLAAGTWNGERAIRWGHDLVPERASAGDWDKHKRVKELTYP